MKRVDKQEDPAASAVIQQTVTTKTVGPAAQAAFPGIPQLSAPPRGKDDINDWFRKLSAAERANEYNYYLYRLDRNIVITNQEVDGREPRKYLAKLSAEVLARLSQGPFIDELVDYIKEEFGGGKYSLKVGTKKTGTMLHNKLFEVDGEAKLTSREGFSPAGMGAGAGMDGTNIGMLLRYIDEKISNARGGTQDPGQAMSQFAKVVMDSNNGAFQWVLQNMPKAPDPMTQLEQTKTIFELVKSLAPPPAAAAQPKTVMEQLQEFALLQKTLNDMKGSSAPPENQPSIASQVVEGLTKAGLGRARGNDYGWLVELGKAIAPALAPLAMAFAKKIETSQIAMPRRMGMSSPPSFTVPQPGAPAGGPPAGGGAVPGGGAAGARMPGQAHAGPVPMPGQPQSSAAPPEPQQPQLTEEQQYSMFVQTTISLRLVDMLTHDRTGEDAAASVNDMFPEAAINMRFATVDMLKNIVATDPILTQVKDDPRLPGFLQSFYDFFHQSEDEGEDTSTKVQ